MPGQNLQPGEQMPCVAAYQESSATSDYWSYYEAHPLCWATGKMGDIRQNESLIDIKEWEALANLAQILPDKNLNSMYIFDGQFNHIASRSHHNLESCVRDTLTPPLSGLLRCVRNDERCRKDSKSLLREYFFIDGLNLLTLVT